MMQSVNSPQSPINIFAADRNPSRNCKIDGLAYDQDIDSPKNCWIDFSLEHSPAKLSDFPKTKENTGGNKTEKAHKQGEV